jgi:hypothetical protein
MTTIYADYANGDDDSGDGTYSLPYKTIDKATTGLTGGDQVRCAVTPQTQLSGTLTFTNGSKTVNTTTDLSGVVSISDIIHHMTTGEAWWLVDSVQTDSITLKHVYWGTAGSGKTGYKITPIVQSGKQTVMASGSNSASLLKVSGGWQLDNQTQTGITAFYVSSGKTLDFFNVTFIELEKFFAHTPSRYAIDCSTNSYLHDLYSSGGAIYTGCLSLVQNIFVAGTEDSNSYEGFVVDGMWQGDYGNDLFNKGNTTAENIWVYSANGIEIYGSHLKFKNINVKNFISYGLYFYDCANVFFEDSTADTSFGNQYDAGFYFDWNNNNIYFKNCSIKNCLGSAIFKYDDCGANGVYFFDLELSGNAGPIFAEVEDDENLGSYPQFIVVNQGEDPYRVYKGFAKITSDSSDARSGKCLKFSPVYNYHVLQEKVGIHKIASETGDITISLYAKKDNSFNGSVEIMILQNGAHLSRTTITPTTNYDKYDVVVDDTTFVVGEYLDIFILILGSLGNVFIDDFSSSQA